MTLSVIIPVYKVEDSLEKCLESVVKQGYPNLEIILVDDGGTDNCPEMCDNLARLYNHESAKFNNLKVVVIHKVNMGLSCARNSGLEVATGEYVTFVDSDDFLGGGTYVKVMTYLSLHRDVDIAEFGVAERYNNPNLRSILTLPNKIFDNEFEYWFETEAYKHTYAWNKIYRRSLFDDIRYPEGKSFEDALILPKLLDKAKRIATLNTGTYFYSWNESGITAKASRRELMEHLLTGVRSLKWVPKEYYKTSSYVKLYASVLNIQLMVFLKTNGCLSLPYRRFRLGLIHEAYKNGMTKEAYLKMLMLRYLKLIRFCKLWRSIYLIKRILS